MTFPSPSKTLLISDRFQIPTSNFTRRFPRSFLQQKDSQTSIRSSIALKDRADAALVCEGRAVPDSDLAGLTDMPPNVAKNSLHFVKN